MRTRNILTDKELRELSEIDLTCVDDNIENSDDLDELFTKEINSTPPSYEAYMMGENGYDR